MATPPLFVADIQTLKKELRLSGVPPASDAQAIIERGALMVRTNFNVRLGVQRVAVLVALPYVPNPVTEDEILRAIANLCEIHWVRLVLLDMLPTIFMDASGGDQEFMNEEGTFRSKEVEALEAERERTLIQIEEWLSILAGDQQLGDSALAQIFVQGDQLPRIFPIGSLVGRNTRLFGDPTRPITEGQIDASEES